MCFWMPAAVFSTLPQFFQRHLNITFMEFYRKERTPHHNASKPTHGYFLAFLSPPPILSFIRNITAPHGFDNRILHSGTFLAGEELHKLRLLPFLHENQALLLILITFTEVPTGTGVTLAVANINYALSRVRCYLRHVINPLEWMLLILSKLQKVPVNQGVGICSRSQSSPQHTQSHNTLQ